VRGGGGEEVGEGLEGWSGGWCSWRGGGGGVVGGHRCVRWLLMVKQ